MKQEQTNVDNSKTSAPKKEKPSKEKKVIPKYYAGTEVRKLPKVPKSAINDLNNLQGLTMTPEQQEAYLTAIVMGFVPDKFGLEAGLDHKLKALAMLQTIQKNRSQVLEEQEEDENDDYLTSLRDALGQRKIKGVDD